MYTEIYPNFIKGQNEMERTNRMDGRTGEEKKRIKSEKKVSGKKFIPIKIEHGPL